MTNFSIWDNLNSEQITAVKTISGPMLILAGAGSGKTRVLTCRIANLLNQGIEPWRILAITFTNKAAKEMRSRIDKMSGLAAKDVQMSTFHSFCAKLLRVEIKNMRPYTKDFVIYDTIDQKALIKQIIKDFNLENNMYPANSILSIISKAKNAMQSPEQFAQDTLKNVSFYQKAADIYLEYQKRLQQNNALDFDDLLLTTVHLFQQHPDILSKYQERFLYIMVDEYQDTNRVQYLLIKLLANKHRNICVVGDADQSIYSWRGADIRNILDFEIDYPDAKIIKLEQNYRSTQNILDAANSVISNNINRKPKKLWTEHKSGVLLCNYTADNAIDEAYFVTEQIKNLITKNISPGEIAVLYRANAQSRVLEEMFIKQGIQYTIVGGTKFYERKEIKDALAYLKVIANPYDTINLQRIINVPKRGIGETTIAKLDTYANNKNLHLFDVISNTNLVKELSPRIATKLEIFSHLIFELINNAPKLSIRNLLEKIFDMTGMLKELENSLDPQDQTRAENLKEFLSVAEDFTKNSEENTLSAFLEQVSLVSDIDTANIQENAVTLMTLHSAKGLEFKTVFITGMDDGVFPISNLDANNNEMEEERRLCYVGMTRAKEMLYLINAKERMLYGYTQNHPPSRFINEIPNNLIQHIQKKNTSITGQCILPTNNYPKKTNVSNVPSWAKKTFDKFIPTDKFSTKTIFEIGDKVSNPKYGIGIITASQKDGDSQELTINFNGEEKIFLTKYAILKKL